MEFHIMCDYSLHGVASRPAKVGDKLVTSEFPNTLTLGLSAVGEPTVAVCLLPGTEIAFDEAVRRQVNLIQWLFSRREKSIIHHKVARFRQINLNNRDAHHDAIEFPDGQIVLLTQLRAGQAATVLQLPAQSSVSTGAKIEAREVSPTGTH
jgi:hypothetical protein